MKETKKQKDKAEKVMDEYKQGIFKSDKNNSNAKVLTRQQAVTIRFNEITRNRIVI